ncbi:hypothetical protein EYZ11_007290 [Aspergillus tanneri]|nr:hypothetical protein EYZ11_007290 [Aspergillus tanneri]
MQDVTVFLLGNININSSHLFRADILHDSRGSLSTPQQKEQSHALSGNSSSQTLPGTVAGVDDSVEPLPPRDIAGFDLTRTVLRRFIPRNPKLDRPLEQTCHFYEAVATQSVDDGEDALNSSGSRSSSHDWMVVYTPHTTSKEDTPYYHPQLRALALLYRFKHDVGAESSGTQTQTSPTSRSGTGTGTLSLHFLPYPDEPVSNRMERTLNALVNTQIRLARGARLSNKNKSEGGNHKPNKDNVIPQHLVQNTYTRLKSKFGPDLCGDWVENTEPSKHVFEDLSIAAFLIELWRSMYGAVPADEKKNPHQQPNENHQPNGFKDMFISNPCPKFPGFVDIACGNGVLVYILLMEGYPGWGFDARRRKTWSIFPESIQSRLKEEIYIPKPFADELISSGREDDLTAHHLTVASHTGVFPHDTFIISNHADELTVWTPLMAALSNPISPLPFLAIPCCSHSLSGSRFRYPPPKTVLKSSSGSTTDPISPHHHETEEGDNPATGSLQSLRKTKQAVLTDETAFNKSMYGSLTAKTLAVAEEIGYAVEKTLLRIPSTRNVGVIGGRVRVIEKWRAGTAQVGVDSSSIAGDFDDVEQRVMDVVRRECLRDGGVNVAAGVWLERARGIHLGPGKGK